MFEAVGNEFYKECGQYELMFRTTNLPIIEEKKLTDIYYNKKKCEYCDNFKSKKYLRKCEHCEFAYYCSIACQTRDWQNNHKKNCSILKEKKQVYNWKNSKKDIAICFN